jgi:hypothetical protein
MEIDLEKNPYGGWERPKRRRLRTFLSGLTRLQRLWLVAAAVYLALLVVTGFLLMPDRGQVERAMAFAVTEEVRRYDGLAFVAESPSGIYEAARREGFDNWIAGVRKKHGIGTEADPDFARIREKYLHDLHSLGDRQMKLLVLLALAWAGPMAALYGAVRVMEWINRGGRE